MIQKSFTNLVENELSLCSRCLSNEINGWVNDRWKELNDEARRDIYQELKTIKLNEGECIVCGNHLVSKEILTKILRILQESDTSEKTVNEFKQFFFLSI